MPRSLSSLSDVACASALLSWSGNSAVPKDWSLSATCRSWGLRNSTAGRSVIALILSEHERMVKERMWLCTESPYSALASSSLSTSTAREHCCGKLSWAGTM